MTTQQPRATSKALAPQVRTMQAQQSPLRKLMSGHNLMMMACCAAMAVGTGVLFASAPAGQSVGQTLLLAAPLVGCLGMHLVMHRFMGKSCHSNSKQEPKND
ncbi:hypothetical protein [Pseudovibrio japonicus]|uniref:hypothetical protein n=1 Tax=Pseudovibrio japonicus TaxID=366534 RepID=UPI001678D978|nr:hypothetical protein [Pseudovibrio japonicus]